MRLHVLPFALACSLLWGVGLFLMTWWIIAMHGASPEPTLIGLLYVGYSLTPTGAFVGLLWGLGDGFIGGALLAALYNWLVGRFGGGD
jgi:hypothetical protein